MFLLKFLALLVAILCQSSVSLAAINQDYGQTSPSCDLKADADLTKITFSQFLNSVPTDKEMEVPCGTKVTVEGGKIYSLDHGLIVKGELHFEDAGPIQLRLPYIIVRGYIFAGSKANPYKGSLDIELFDYGTDLVVENLSPKTKFQTLLKFGRKVFAIYGGRVNFYGAVSTPVYATLRRTTVPGNRRIFLNEDVSKIWKKNDVIAIAPTTHTNQDYTTTGIVGRMKNRRDGSTIVFLKAVIKRFHTVRHVELTDGSNRDIEMSPVVVKLDRNIRIRGMPPATDLDSWVLSENVDPVGGHFIVAHSAEPNVVRGVEFIAMGQPGTLGRYPLHFHFGADASSSYAGYNSIHHSKQRCLVVHATHNLLVEHNVAFKTRGHCFMTEDGIETGNKFHNNIGVAIRRSIKNIVIGPRDVMSDSSPAVFWMTNPTNDLVDNIAAASQGSGFWYELHSRLRGHSRDMQLPGWRTINMQRSNFGKFEGNAAYVMSQGLRTYSPGSHPPNTALLNNFFTWTVNDGWLSSVGSNQKMTNSIMVDVFSKGFNSHHVEGFTFENIAIVGERFSEWACDRDYRTTGLHFENDIHENRWYYGLRGIVVRNLHFQEFARERNCKNNIAINIKIDEENNWFPSSSSFDSVTKSDVDQLFNVEYFVSKHQMVGFHVKNPGHPEVKGEGFMISSPFNGEDILAKDCGPAGQNLTNLIYCKGQCWRHISLAWNDPPGYSNTKIRFIWEEGGDEYFEEDPKHINMWIGDTVTRLITKLVPAGTYHVKLLDQNGVLIPDEKYNIWTIYMIRPDERLSDHICSDDAHFLVHGVEVPEAI